MAALGTPGVKLTWGYIKSWAEQNGVTDAMEVGGEDRNHTDFGIANDLSVDEGTEFGPGLFSIEFRRQRDSR